MNIYHKFLFKLFPKNNFRMRVPNYINRDKGMDALILAPGPTLDTHFDQINNFINNKKKNLRIFSINFYNLNFDIDYIIFTNRKRFKLNLDWIIKKNLNYFFSPYLNENLINFLKIKQYELIMYEDNFENIFNINNGIINTNCRSSSILAIALCIVMGYKNIFIAGLDGFSDYIKSSKKFHSKNSINFNDDYSWEEKCRLEKLDSDNYIKLLQINDFLSNRKLNSFKIITPTIFNKFYYPIS